MALGGVHSSLHQIATDLLAYGEKDLANVVLTLDTQQHERLAVAAAEYLYLPNSSGLLAYCLAMAAVIIIEGRERPLKRKKRLMEVYSEGYGE